MAIYGCEIVPLPVVLTFVIKNNRTPNLGNIKWKDWLCICDYNIMNFCGHIYNDRQFWDVADMKDIIFMAV